MTGHRGQMIDGGGVLVSQWPVTGQETWPAVPTFRLIDGVYGIPLMLEMRFSGEATFRRC